MVLNTFSLTYSFIFMIFGFNYALENSEMYVIKQEIFKLIFPYRKVYCNTPEQIGGDILSLGYYVSISVTLVTIFNYIVVGIIIKCMFNLI